MNYLRQAAIILVQVLTSTTGSVELGLAEVILLLTK